MIRSSILIVLAAIASACGNAGPDVTVFAAASVAEAVEEVAAAFEAESGRVVSVSAAATSVLAQQIAAGAEADLFLSASVEWADYLADKDLIESRIDLLGNRLVLAVAEDSALIESPDDLLKAEIRRIAVADTDSVPAGQYAKRALTDLGLWDALEPKLMPAGNVRQALLYLEQGEAHAALIYATDARLSDTIQPVFEFEKESTGAIVYPLLLTSHGAASEPARAFFDYLQSEESQTVFKQRGFHAMAP